MEKSWFQSKTIIGAGLVMISGAIQATGVHIDPLTGDFSGNIYDVASKFGPLALQIGGGALAIWGRAKASMPIKPIRTRKAKG